MPEAGETAKYPSATVALADLASPVDNFGKLTLDGDHSAAIGTLTVLENIPATWPQALKLTWDKEIVRVVSWAGKVFTLAARDGSLLNSEGTVATIHSSGTRVGRYLTEGMWNQLAAEVIAVETALRGTLDVGNASTDFIRFIPGASPAIHAVGASANIPITLTSKGTGSVFIMGAAGSRNLAVFTTGAAQVNYFQFNGGATGVPVVLFSAGADADVGLGFSSKGAGSITLYTGDTARIAAQFLNVAGSVNYLGVYPAITGAGPALLPSGPDTNIALNLYSKGTGTIWLASGSGSRILANFSDTASAVNYWQFNNAVTGTGPVITATGTDANVGVNINSKGTGAVTLGSGSGARTLATFADAASAVNSWFFTPAATTAAVQAAPSGSDTNIPVSISSKGNSSVYIRANNHGRTIAEFVDAGTTVNFLYMSGNITGSGPYVRVAGTDTNIPLNISSKGTGAISFYAADGARLIFQTVDNASTVNYITVHAVAAGGYPRFIAAGSDTDVGIVFSGKGSAGQDFYSHSLSYLQMRLLPISSAVNFLELMGAVTTGAPQIRVGGSDTNIHLNLVPKGTGVVNFSYAGVALGGGATATMTTAMGGSGPATANINSWLRVQVAGSTKYIPLWV